MKRMIAVMMLLSLALGACTGGGTQAPPTNTPIPTAPQATAGMMPTKEPTSVGATAPAGAVIEHLAVGQEIFIHYVSMFEPLRGWAVGGTDSGDDHILLTYESGQTWLDVTPPEPASDNEQGKRATIFFRNLERGWATYYPEEPVSVLSRVWFTNDRGKTWQSSQPIEIPGIDSPSLKLDTMFFVDDNNGWIVLSAESSAGNQPVVIYTTSDGGSNWQQATGPGSGDNGSIEDCCRTGVAFLDSKVAIITSLTKPEPVPHVNWSTDGGKTWQPQVIPSADPDLFARSLCGTLTPNALSAQSVTMIVNCIEYDGMKRTDNTFIYFTNDLGQTWQWLPTPWIAFAEGDWVEIDRSYTLQFLSAETGWLIVNDFYTDRNDAAKNRQLSQIFRTLDGGQNWTKMHTTERLGQFSFIDADMGWAALVVPPNMVPLLTETVTGGQKWQPLKPTITE